MGAHAFHVGGGFDGFAGFDERVPIFACEGIGHVLDGEQVASHALFLVEGHHGEQGYAFASVHP